MQHTMQVYTKSVLSGIAFLFFGAIFLIACILITDIRGRFYPEENDVLETEYDHVYISLQSVKNTTAQKNIVATGSIGRKVVCYLTIPEEDDSTQYLKPQDVDPNLCSHILVGFASIVNCTLNLGSNIQFFKDASNLKTKNPSLKVMISVGGGNEVASGFPEMTQNHANRKKFIKSVLVLLKSLRLDGLDIDWEFPGWLAPKGRQRIHFVQLLYELKKAFNKGNQNLVLSAAVAAAEAIIDQSYNIPEIAEHVDFVNLMTYDYHYYSRLLPFTGFNAPLYPNAKETGFLSTVNVNFSSNYWVEKGMPREKIIIGIPTYGHSYKLYNADNHGLQAPCKDYGSLGSSGYVSYSITCNFLANSATRVFDNDSKVPYTFRDTEWISYDDILSVTIKANWIRSFGFGGAMIFSLNTDDWNAKCDNNTSFPLTRTVTKIINNEE